MQQMQKLTFLFALCGTFIRPTGDLPKTVEPTW